MRPHAASVALLVALATGGCGDPASSGPSGDGGPAATSAAPADEPTSSIPSQEQEQPPGPDPSDPPTAPDGARLAPLDGSEPAVRWTPNGFEVRAFGSSSCPPTATSVQVLDPSSVVIELQPGGGAACTDDLAPHNSFVPAPDGLSRDEPLEVRMRTGEALSNPITVKFLDNTLL